MISLLEIHQLSDYKRKFHLFIHSLSSVDQYSGQLTLEIQVKQSEYTHQLIQLDYLKSTRVRHHLTELNSLQLERDSLITQIELIKYNLFEQMQENDEILRNYRQSLNSFRSTINELEQQLKQQTDLELNHLQISPGFARVTIHDDTEKLILIFERKIEEKKSINHQLEISIHSLHEQILQQKQFAIKKEKDLQTMDHLDQQINSNIRVMSILSTHVSRSISFRSTERFIFA